ncbi:MAG: hypothetical protein CM15mP23_09160 [Cryomorphaceae bacterium]|nr:MAG: hypothetical protein CM15mP23_09160 [Cryomorphaceae bacterium]
MTGSADGSIAYDLQILTTLEILIKPHGTIGHLQDALNYHASALVIDFTQDGIR